MALFAFLLANLVGQANALESKLAAVVSLQTTEKQLTLAREQAETAVQRRKKNFWPT